MAESDTEPIRSSLLRLLDLIGDFEAQRAYEQDVPIANVPAELVCMWFDDAYHPDSEQHAKAFSARERKLLERFHMAYEKCADDLPCDNGVAVLQQSSQWIAVSQEAAKTAGEIRDAS